MTEKEKMWTTHHLDRAILMMGQAINVLNNSYAQNDTALAEMQEIVVAIRKCKKTVKGEQNEN